MGLLRLMTDDQYPGEVIYPEAPYAGSDPRPPKPQFVRDDEDGWRVPETGRWRPDDAGAF